MMIDAIRRKTAAEIHTDVSQFATRYVQDWETWLAADPNARPDLFGRVLRKWQATRPRAMRRLRREATHDAPFLDDLLDQAKQPIAALGGLSIVTISQRTSEQNTSLAKLWALLSRLTTSGTSTCVGITKAVLLLTDGRMGPAFDRHVRHRLGVDRPTRCDEWLRILDLISDDIAEFESMHGPLVEAIPHHFAHLEYGRIYDMALGPR